MGLIKKFTAAILLTTAIFAFGGCVKYTSTRQVTASGEDLTGLHHVEIEIEGYGTIAAELDADAAPKSVTRFVSAAEDGFYNGKKFHRIIEGFMMQGGAMKTKDEASKYPAIYGEFSSNGFNNPIKHERGVLSMARTDKPNSATTQFFIVHQDYPSLDGNYAAFGHVTSGIEIVDKICDANNIPEGANGAIAEDDQPVIKEVRVID